MQTEVDEIMQYSFKILIHEVQIITKELVLLQDPKISVSLINFPKLLIQGHHQISSMKQQTIAKAFNHGKQALIQMPYQKLTDVLQKSPIEITLINEDYILAVAHIKMTQFLSDIEPNQSKKQFHFRRGTFHMHTKRSELYALVDISISIAPVIVQASKHEVQKKLIAFRDSHKKVEIVSKQPSVDPQQITHPEPEQIIYRPKNKPLKPYKERPRILLNQAALQQKQKKNQPIPKKVQVSFSQSRDKSTDQRDQTSKENQKSSLEKSQSSSKQKLPDMTIQDFLNAAHCPPPLVVENKTYIQEYLVTPPLSEKKIEDKVSVQIQTDDSLLLHYIQQHHFQVVPQKFPDMKSQEIKSIISDQAYDEDFESIEQSQSQSQQFQFQSQIKSITSPSIIQMKKQKQFTQSELDEQISEIYSEQFDTYNQTQSMQRTQSLEKLNDKNRRILVPNQFEDSSDAYIQEFDSISVSHTHSQQLLGRRR